MNEGAWCVYVPRPYQKNSHTNTHIDMKRMKRMKIERKSALKQGIPNAG